MWQVEGWGHGKLRGGGVAGSLVTRLSRAPCVKDSLAFFEGFLGYAESACSENCVSQSECLFENNHVTSRQTQRPTDSSASVESVPVFYGHSTISRQCNPRCSWCMSR